MDVVLLWIWSEKFLNLLRDLLSTSVSLFSLSSFTQVKALLSEGINRPRKGHDAGDHPPITPMRAATEAELGIGKLGSVGTLCGEISSLRYRSQFKNPWVSTENTIIWMAGSEERADFYPNLNF